jgi:hypothetical protein
VFLPFFYAFHVCSFLCSFLCDPFCFPPAFLSTFPPYTSPADRTPGSDVVAIRQVLPFALPFIPSVLLLFVVLPLCAPSFCGPFLYSFRSFPFGSFLFSRPCVSCLVYLLAFFLHFLPTHRPTDRTTGSDAIATPQCQQGEVGSWMQRNTTLLEDKNRADFELEDSRRQLVRKCSY